MDRLRCAAMAALLVLWTAPPAAGQGLGTILEPDPQIEGTRVGTRAANFLKLGVGARALGLGGAYTALAEDIYSLYWNPAGLAHVNRLTAAFTHAALFDDADITQQFVGLGAPALGGVVGISGIFFDSGDIPRTTEEFPQGGDPTFGDTYTYNASAIGLHYGRFVTDRLSIGFAAKVVSEGITDARANYVGLDAGIRFNTGLFGTTIGAALTNVGSEGSHSGAAIERQVPGSETNMDVLRPIEVGLRTTKFTLPTAFHFGIQTSLIGGASAVLMPSADHRLLALVQFDDGIDSAIQPGFGAEYTFRDLLSVRGGKKVMNEARTEHFRNTSHGLSAGLGVRLPVGLSRRAGFDYAFVDMGELQNIQVFSFEFVF